MLAVWLFVGLLSGGVQACTILDQAFCSSLCETGAWDQPLVVVVGPELDLSCISPSLQVSICAAFCGSVFLFLREYK